MGSCPSNKAEANHMKMRQKQLLEVAQRSSSENWAFDKLKSTGFKWNRQPTPYFEMESAELIIHSVNTSETKDEIIKIMAEALDNSECECDGHGACDWKKKRDREALK